MVYCLANALDDRGYYPVNSVQSQPFILQVPVLMHWCRRATVVSVLAFVAR